jgi:hypothetical protein
MKVQPELTIPKVSEAKNKQWKAPININLYDRSSCLTKFESAEIKLVLERNKKWLAKSHRELERLLHPLYDTLKLTGATRTSRSRTIHIILTEMN